MLIALVAAAVTGLQGNWTVDLRPTPQAKEYTQPMKLEIAPDGSLGGTFYGYPFAGGRAASSNGRACFAFSTADQSGPYQHSGCLTSAGQIEGLSWSEGRKLLLAWKAKAAAK